MKRVHMLDDVFGVSRKVPENYVVRESVDGALVRTLARHKHIVIFGSSKQGKTCLRKYNLTEQDYALVTCNNKWTIAQLNTAVLKAVGYKIDVLSTRAVSGESKISANLSAGVNYLGNKIEVGVSAEDGASESREESQKSIELDPGDVNDVIAALDKARSAKFVVLEDFHYLPEETQKDFAVALKAFHEDSDYCFIVVGVWRDQNRLILQNGDLTGRVESIDADAWSEGELREAISEGERLLGVSFSGRFKEELLKGCFESIFVVQEACRRACEEASVFETRGETVELDPDAPALIGSAVDSHSARYNSFISTFADGFRETELQIYRWLLWPVLTSEVKDLERGLKYSFLRDSIDRAHPKAPINNGNFTLALQAIASLQIAKMKIKPIILDYDQTSRRLNVVDRSFLIWLQHQTRSDLLELAELPAS